LPVILIYTDVNKTALIAADKAGMSRVAELFLPLSAPTKYWQLFGRF
jgi:hypothetical protein